MVTIGTVDKARHMWLCPLSEGLQYLSYNWHLITYKLDWYSHVSCNETITTDAFFSIDLVDHCHVRYYSLPEPTWLTSPVRMFGETGIYITANAQMFIGIFTHLFLIYLFYTTLFHLKIHFYFVKFIHIVNSQREIKVKITPRSYPLGVLPVQSDSPSFGRPRAYEPS